MYKKCQCKHTMDIVISSIKYTHKIEFTNVPVFICANCGEYALPGLLKSEIKQIIGNMSADITEQTIDFSEHHELAALLVTMKDQEQEEKSFDEMVEERINHLLDLMLLADSLQEDEWLKEVSKRLEQLTAQYSTASDFNH